MKYIKRGSQHANVGEATYRVYTRPP
jgi:hypothetical protein